MVDHESGQMAAGLSYLVVTSKRLPIELSPTFRADMNFLALESCTGTTAAKVRRCCSSTLQLWATRHLTSSTISMSASGMFWELVQIFGFSPWKRLLQCNVSPNLVPEVLLKLINFQYVSASMAAKDLSYISLRNIYCFWE